MNLTKLLSFDKITIQCSDNPDDDSLASGFALYEFFKTNNKDVKLFYSGKDTISQANLLEMIRLLHIPIVHEEKPAEIEGLLIMVACQYGAKNAAQFFAKHVAVIDDHVQEVPPPVLHEIQPTLGSCSTLVWQMLREAEFDMSIAVTTALYYGLFKGTNGFKEIGHPLDRDLRDSVDIQKSTLQILKDTDYSLADVQQASTALQNIKYYKEDRFAIVPVRPYVPYLLGLVADLAMKDADIDIVFVYCEVVGGFRFSIRSSKREYKAAELARWMTGSGLGSGGGSNESAGGSISLKNYLEQRPNTVLGEYIENRLQRYINTYVSVDVIEPDSINQLGRLIYKTYEKLPNRLGYVPCSKVSANKIKLDIRMLEGDISIVSNDQAYLMIGMQGEVYPIEQKKFENTYTALKEPFTQVFDYPPMVHNTVTEERIALMSLARACQSKSSLVKACQLPRPIKLFTKWDEDNYITGERNDWLIMRGDDPADLYIITRDMFPKLYKEI